MSTPKIVLLFSVLSLMMIAIGSVLGLFLGSIILWMSVFFLIAIAINVVSYYKSDSIAIKMTRTNIINRKDDPRFYSIVEKVTGMAGIPMPKVGIYKRRELEKHEHIVFFEFRAEPLIKEETVPVRVRYDICLPFSYGGFRLLPCVCG